MAAPERQPMTWRWGADGARLDQLPLGIQPGADGPVGEIEVPPAAQLHPVPAPAHAADHPAGLDEEAVERVGPPVALERAEKARLYLVRTAPLRTEHITVAAVVA